jgi:hypothetical protein
MAIKFGTMCQPRYHEISLTKKHGASNASCLEGATWLRLVNQTVLLPQPEIFPHPPAL